MIGYARGEILQTNIYLVCSFCPCKIFFFFANYFEQKMGYNLVLMP